MITRRTVIIGVVTGLAVLAVGWIWGDWLVKCARALFALYGTPDAIRDLVAGFGIWAPLIFVGLQVLQVVLSPIPGEATGVLGGYLFGTWLGLRLVRRILPIVSFEKLSAVARPQGVAVTFVLFSIPGFPKDYLSYLLGLTPMSWGSFLLVSSLGRVPGTWLLSAQGAVAGTNQYGPLLLLVALGAALSLV